MNLLELLNMNKTKISDDSYKKYAKYYDYIEPSDSNFDKKVDKIYDLIINENVNDIEFIAQESGCTFEECVMKIRYLKNKRVIGDYYIDLITKTIKLCSLEEQKLLEKYSKYLYNQHLQVSEIALKMPSTTYQNIQEAKDQVYKDLLYLYEKGLLNGIKLNSVDYAISYYTIDKRKKNLELITVKCPNCGALNDLYKYGKVRCEYCETIIEDKENIYNNDNI